MAFSLDKFYRELDNCYDSHDLKAIEDFLLHSKKTAYADSLAVFPNDGCPSCVPEAVPNMNYVSVCNEQACFYRGLSRFEDSLAAFSDAEQELESYYKKDTVEYATVLLNKAGTYRYMHDLDNALALFLRAAEIMKEAGPDRTEVLCGLYNNIGLVFLDLREPEKAAAYFMEAMNIVENIPEMIVQCGSTWNNLATAYDLLGKRELADTAVQNAISILGALEDGNECHYPAALNTRGTFAFRAGNYEAALKDFKEALEKTRLIYGENVEYAYACSNCAAVCEKLGRSEEAAAWTAKSKEILSRISGSKD